MTSPVALAVFGLLFDSSTEIVFLVDRTHGRLVCANLPAAELLVTTEAALEGVSLQELTHEPRDLSHAGHYEEVGLLRSDGYPVFVDLDIVHVDHDEHGALAAFIGRDTTERRTLQLDLVAKHSALISAHADLERAHQELERRNQDVATLAWRVAMGELVAGIAHHLNNPVAALTSTVMRLRAKVATVTGPERAELDRLFERVAKISSRIEHNVGEIVRITHIVSRGHRQVLPAELAKHVESLAQELDSISTKETP